jgi:class 3 adenylate cyclase
MMLRWMAVLGCLWLGPVYALDTISVRSDVKGLPLGGYLEYFADESGELTIDEVIEDKTIPWMRTLKIVPTFGFTTTPHWFTIQVNNESPAQRNLILEVATSVLDNVEVYYVSYGTVVDAYQAGDKFRFSERPVDHRNFLFPLKLGPGEKVQVFLRVQTTTSLQLPLSLWSEDSFYKHDEPYIYAHGLFYGIMLVAMLFSLFIFISIREKQYLFYALYVLFHTSFQAAAHGTTFQYLWPDAVWWHEKSIALFAGAAIVFSALFAIEFLSLRNSRHPNYYMFLKVVAIISGIVAIMTLFLPYATTIRLIIPLSLLMVGGCFFSGIVRAREGDTAAQLYTAAWASFLLGITMLTLNRIDIIPRNIFTENAMQVGAAIEVILLLTALSQRLSQEIRERFRLQEEALRQQQSLNVILEERVEERTSALANKNKQLLALSNKLAKYLSPQLYEQIFTGKRDVRLETRRKKLTVFFSDIKDFTRVTDSMESEALTDLLNNYLNEMAETAIRFGGTVDKFIGDAIMVFFGDPESRGHQQDALYCVMMALEMRRLMVELRARWMAEGVNSPLQIRIGINTGYCTVGNFGSDNRLDYTIVGGEVNIASRLESNAEPNTILVSESTYALIKDKVSCVQVDDINAKGVDKPIKAYRVLDLVENLEGQMRHIQDEDNGFILSVDMNVASRQRVTRALENALELTRGQEAKDSPTTADPSDAPDKA